MNFITRSSFKANEYVVAHDSWAKQEICPNNCKIRDLNYSNKDDLPQDARGGLVVRPDSEFLGQKVLLCKKKKKRYRKELLKDLLKKPSRQDSGKQDKEQKNKKIKEIF